VDNVRHATTSDLPAVAALFQRVFRHTAEAPPPSLLSYFDALYFKNPLFDESLSSLVYETEGRIAGFVGTYPFPFRLNGARVMTVLAGNLMVDPDLKNPMAAPRLMKQLFAGPQDATLTDTANDNARRLWEALGSVTVQSYSLQWLRPLRPARYAGSLAARESRALARLELLTRPLSLLVDSTLQHMKASPLHLESSDLAEKELTPEVLLDGIRALSARRALVPDYDITLLKWLLANAEEKREYGRLKRVVLYDVHGSLAGWYLFYTNPGSAGQVLQWAATPSMVTRVFRHLLRDASTRGSLALIGRFDPHMVREMSTLGCFFTNRGTHVQAHSRRPELIQALYSGDAFFTRLEGEWWTRLQGDRFD
jgi:Acetyltransferase (GNAT) domain